MANMKVIDIKSKNEDRKILKECLEEMKLIRISIGARLASIEISYDKYLSNQITYSELERNRERQTKEIIKFYKRLNEVREDALIQYNLMGD